MILDRAAVSAAEALVEARHLPATTLALSDFRSDEPFSSNASMSEAQGDSVDGLIHEVTLRRLGENVDRRGHLTELYSLRSGDGEAAVHAYQVFAQPGSVRAWVYHRYQRDRLAYTQGNFHVALYDLRPESPTFQHFNLLRLGSANPVRLDIPPFVVHGVYNAGTAVASFINMPTNVWSPTAPDKCRIPYPDPRLPFTFSG